ncbi:MAG: tetratricopeptide repeat protein, partial [Nitrospirae bacterium]|nr:tetratricopeptide repeat protein [Nitrospirota bacterium]
SRLQLLVSRRVSPFISGLLSTKLLFLAALAALLLVVPGPVRAETDETTLFMNGYQAHLQGENDKAIATLNDVIKKYPKGKMTDLALYWLGKTYVKVGRPQDAIQAFRTLKTKHPKSAMAPLASEQLARLEKEQVAALPPSKEPSADKPPEGLAPPTRLVPERKVEPERPAPPPPVVAKKEPPPAPEKKEPIAKATPPPAPKPAVVAKPPAVAKIEEPPQAPPVKEAKPPRDGGAVKPEDRPAEPAGKEKKEPERVAKAPVKPKPAKPSIEAPSKEEKQRAAADHRRKAIESYEKIVQAAPASPEAARARKRLAALGVREKPPTPAKPAVLARKEPPLHAPQPGESVFLVVERV